MSASTTFYTNIVTCSRWWRREMTVRTGQSLSHNHDVINLTGVVVETDSLTIRKKDGFDGDGFDTISGLGVAKNVLTVGAMRDLFDEGAVVPGAKIATTVFSGYGPTDDLRIKPDVLANGETLTSPSAEGDARYTEKSGTSMAAPTTAGICALLAEFFEDQHGRKPTSAELKAVVIHTAKDDSAIEGPDPASGWGSVNALLAGDMISRGDGRTKIHAKVIDRNAEESFNLQPLANPEGKSRITVVWTDPAGPGSSNRLDEDERKLRNDIDIELIDPNGVVHHPYRIERPDNLSQNPKAVWARSDGPNKVDNVEVIDASLLNDGRLWTLKATGIHKTMLW